MNNKSLDTKCAFSADVIAEMRDWISDCQWGDLDPEDIAELSSAAIIAGIRRHFDGGIPAFLEAIA